MSKLLLDARWINPPRTGVGNYCLNLINELCRTEASPGIIVNPDSPTGSFPPGTTFIKTKIRVNWHPLTQLFEQILIPIICLKGGYNSFVSFEGRVPVLRFGIKTFSVIYDLTTFNIQKSHNFKYTLLMRYNLIISRYFATGIVTISQTVKKQISTRLNYPSDRIHVVYPADSLLKSGTEIKSSSRVPEKFFLTVGITNQRKNLEFLLSAFQKHRQNHPESSLVVTGNSDMIEKILNENPVKGVLNMGFVDESVLAGLYREALALVYPSKEEGFGIPLLDAVKSDCNVICSKIPVFKEVLGKGNGYFDLSNIQNLTDLLDSVTENTEIKFEKPREFSWKKSAIELCKITGIS